MKMVTEDLVNWKEDDVSTEEAIDVKRKKILNNKKKTLTCTMATLKEEDIGKKKE